MTSGLIIGLWLAYIGYTPHLHNLAPEASSTLTKLSWLAGIVLPLGLAGVLHWLSYTRSTSAQLWPTAPATVTSSRQKTAGLGIQSRFERFSMKYAYEVGGRQFHAGFFSDSGENFSALWKKYARGKAFAVFYNPNNPGRSDVGDAMGLMGDRLLWRHLAYGLYVVAFGATCGLVELLI